VQDNTSIKAISEAYRDMHTVNEGTVQIQVMDPESVIKDLKKYRVNAKPGKLDDEIAVDTKDATKVVDYMVRVGGYDFQDIKDLYPELLK